jgi:hypothetical protein
VAQYLDLAVGFQISTVTTETAITETPSLHINFTGVYEHL